MAEFERSQGKEINSHRSAMDDIAYINPIPVTPKGTTALFPLDKDQLAQKTLNIGTEYAWRPILSLLPYDKKTPWQDHFPR